MMRPIPFIIFCKKCQYSKIIHPKSDAIKLSEITHFCPTCHLLMVQKEKLTALDQMKLFFFKKLKNIPSYIRNNNE